MFVVIAYDISDNRRRTRLHKTLKHFGFAVQESVFECHLTDAQLGHLKAVAASVVDPRLDQVRFYYLCEACQRRNEMTEASLITGDPAVVIV